MVDGRDLLDSLDGVALLLDADCRIVGMGRRNWDRFWQENGGAADAPEVLGTDVTDHFTAGTVRAAFRLALQDLLAGRRPPIRLSFRCDSPRIRRDMQLSVTRCGAHHLLYHAIQVASRPILLPAHQPHAAAGGPATAICTLCGRHDTRAEDGPDAPFDWALPEQHAAMMPGPARHGTLTLPTAHAAELCPRCYFALTSPSS